jgi:polyisoprenyl-teichoic acid--peptidoglycan teichoic acid transferase
MAKRIDLLRLYALIILLLSIIYFYLNLFSPKTLPYFVRFWPLPKNMNVLVMGLDTAYDKTRHVALSDVGHTDTMILVNINTNSFKVNMLSIPRDTLVEIPGYGWQKINAAYFLGGPALAKETVEKFLGVPVNHYVTMNPRGLINLIDLMGGVRVYVDKDMYYVDNWGGLKINLKKGWQTLNGDMVNGFIRFRQDPLGDVSRVQRQQEFLQTVLRRLATPAILAKAPWVLAIAAENIKTDLSLKDILVSLNFARGLRKDDINMTMVPGSFAVGELGASIWAPDQEALRDIVNKYFSKKLLAKLEPKHLPSSAITIINNTDDFEAVRQMMKVLYKKEYAIVNVSSQKKPGTSKTQIIAQKGDRSGAEKLGGLLGIKEVFVSSTGDTQSDFTIVVCNDWKEYLEKSISR